MSNSQWLILASLFISSSTFFLKFLSQSLIFFQSLLRVTSVSPSSDLTKRIKVLKTAICHSYLFIKKNPPTLRDNKENESCQTQAPLYINAVRAGGV